MLTLRELLLRGPVFFNSVLTFRPEWRSPSYFLTLGLRRFKRLVECLQDSIWFYNSARRLNALAEYADRLIGLVHVRGL